jgi:hypothetical protein
MRLMPSWDKIPDEYKKRYGKSWGHKLMNDWFFSGARLIKATPKEGINKNDALDNIECILHSFDPKHEHKEAAIAYLFELWFEEIKWEVT